MRYEDLKELETLALGIGELKKVGSKSDILRKLLKVLLDMSYVDIMESNLSYDSKQALVDFQIKLHEIVLYSMYPGTEKKK